MSDLIEREEVIDAICNKCMLDHKMERRMPALCRNCRTVKMIQAIPSARPKGDWVSEGRIYPPTNGYHGAVCSICGTESEYLTNFCGECGADMRKGEPQTECDNDCSYRVDGLGCMRLGGCYKESE